MAFSNVAFWLFLAATTVASLTFVSIIVWAKNRLQERQEFYRFEFRKRLVEDGKMDAAAFASLMRYEHELGLQQVRQKLMVASFVILGTGVGICAGFQFISGDVWKLGLIPVSVGLSMLVFGIFFAAKSNPGLPPDLSPETHERD